MLIDSIETYGQFGLKYSSIKYFFKIISNENENKDLTFMFKHSCPRIEDIKE